MLAAYAILVLGNVVPKAPSNIAPDKIQAIQAMSFELCLRMYTEADTVEGGEGGAAATRPLFLSK